MKIPRSLPQFEKFPALFITSGEYEAHFHVALKGNFKRVHVIKMAPREEAKEKQAFVGHKPGMQSLSAFSHKGSYDKDLKMKFARSVHEKIKDLISEHELEEIYLFTPKYAVKRILNTLSKSELEKVRMQFYKEYTKDNPLKLIESFAEELENIQKITMETPRKQIVLG